MSAPDLTRELLVRLQEARRLMQSGQTLQAEVLYAKILRESPSCVEAATCIAGLAAARGDGARAAEHLEVAFRVAPQDSQIGLDLAFAHLSNRQPDAARQTLDAVVKATPSFAPAWLLLGDVREALGDGDGALKARYQAITRAQAAGQWKSDDTVPAEMRGAVLNAMAQLQRGRRELLSGCLADLRQQHGTEALKRVDRAVAGYLGDWNATPPDTRQRPTFFYFPGLPDRPYHDPFLQPWAPELATAFPVIQAEARQLLVDDGIVESFLDFAPGTRRETYVAGDGPQPAWNAFFFYRHGQRYAASHQRCPGTSAVLESLDLCRIKDQAPEICFSLLTPGSTIMPHHGVTNTRLVMHLPLLVPAHCALNLTDVGEHQWQEGRLMMFDDTYRHEAWNRSASARVILLMDCWNPYLDEVERLAVARLVETISEFEH